MVELRFKVLLDNQIIDEQTYQDVLNVRQKIILENGYTDEDSVVLLTHLAMALQRIKKEETLPKLDEMMLQEIKNLSSFEKAKQLGDQLQEVISIHLPTSEMEFVWLHFATLLEKEGKHD